MEVSPARMVGELQSNRMVVVIVLTRSASVWLRCNVSFLLWGRLGNLAVKGLGADFRLSRPSSFLELLCFSLNVYFCFAWSRLLLYGDGHLLF